jgi:hypothetical protein
VAIIGEEKTVRRQVKSLEDAGVAELQARTRELLAA